MNDFAVEMPTVSLAEKRKQTAQMPTNFRSYEAQYDDSSRWLPCDAAGQSTKTQKRKAEQVVLKYHAGRGRLDEREPALGLDGADGGTATAPRGSRTRGRRLPGLGLDDRLNSYGLGHGDAQFGQDAEILLGHGVGKDRNPGRVGRIGFTR